MSEQIQNQMQDRVANGLDPLTGEPMQTVGEIRVSGDKCVDQTGREVTLNNRGTWVYA